MAKLTFSAATVRRQVEAALEKRIPPALTPAPKIRSAVHSTGIRALDELLNGGLPQAFSANLSALNARTEPRLLSHFLRA